jgi:hypothetical protein
VTPQIVTEVEVYPVANFTKEIVGGTFGGLLLLAIITAALYKVTSRLCVDGPIPAERA